jgi:hypothetical protein
LPRRAGGAGERTWLAAAQLPLAPAVILQLPLRSPDARGDGENRGWHFRHPRLINPKLMRYGVVYADNESDVWPLAGNDIASALGEADDLVRLSSQPVGAGRNRGGHSRR